MVNLFAELTDAHNPLTSEGAMNVAAVVRALSQADTFNLMAHAAMEIAHDLHAHGSREEAALAEHMVAGVAQGLKIEREKRYRRCPNCGRRHP